MILILNHEVVLDGLLPQISIEIKDGLLADALNMVGIILCFEKKIRSNLFSFVGCFFFLHNTELMGCMYSIFGHLNLSRVVCA